MADDGGCDRVAVVVLVAARRHKDVAIIGHAAKVANVLGF